MGGNIPVHETCDTSNFTKNANLSITKRYLGKVSDTEVMRWIENLYA